MPVGFDSIGAATSLLGAGGAGGASGGLSASSSSGIGTGGAQTLGDVKGATSQGSGAGSRGLVLNFLGGKGNTQTNTNKQDGVQPNPFPSLEDLVQEDKLQLLAVIGIIALGGLLIFRR